MRCQNCHRFTDRSALLWQSTSLHFDVLCIGAASVSQSTWELHSNWILVSPSSGFAAWLEEVTACLVGNEFGNRHIIDRLRSLCFWLVPALKKKNCATIKLSEDWFPHPTLHSRFKRLFLTMVSMASLGTEVARQGFVRVEGLSRQEMISQRVGCECWEELWIMEEEKRAHLSALCHERTTRQHEEKGSTFTQQHLADQRAVLTSKQCGTMPMRVWQKAGEREYMAKGIQAKGLLELLTKKAEVKWLYKTCHRVIPTSCSTHRELKYYL